MRAFHNSIATKNTTESTRTTTQQTSDISATESEIYFHQHGSSSQNRASLGIKTT